jgi:phosphatidylglycerophosphate synthase
LSGGVAAAILPAVVSEPGLFPPAAASEPEAGRVAAAAPAPLVLSATRLEAAGASLIVGGLRVVERAILQLGRLPDLRVVVASDGTVLLPSPLPPNVEARAVAADGDPAVAVSALARALGGAPVIGADVVRLDARELEGGVRVVDAATRRQAEDAVFADLLRGDLGLVARYVNKKISFRITRSVLCHLPITPNQVTLGAGVLGLLGALLIATGRYPAVVAGFLLAQAQSILDGCDGELARVRFQQSATGEWLDTVVDDFLNIALAVGIGFGVARRYGSPAGLWLGLAAAAMLLTYNVIAYRELLRQGEGGDVLKIRWWFARGSNMKSVTGAGAGGGLGLGLFNLVFLLGKRDFFLLVWLILAVLDRLPVVLVYSLVQAAACFVSAVGQVIADRRAAPG